jgi:uncharacterized protein (DUF58 family)
VLTRQGWILVVGAVGLGVAGRVFGLPELYLGAATAAVLALAALGYVRLSRSRLRIARTVHPATVHAGDAAKVELSVTNRGGGRTPVLRLRDPVAGTRGALVHLAPLRPNGQVRAAYRLPTSRRGVVRVGPLELELQDPFGLARRAVKAAPVLELVVYPAVVPVGAPHQGGDRNPQGAAVHPNAIGHQGDEFYAIREYVVGDDLRRVDWRTTARREELMVRQDELPWQDRTTVVLDTRRANHTADSFERAVVAAASVVNAAARARHHLRVLATDGTDLSPGTGLAHAESVLGWLARVEVEGSGSLRRTLSTLQRPSNGGALVVVTGRTSATDLDAMAALRRTFRSVVDVVSEGPLPRAAATGAVVATVDGTTAASFGPSWSSRVAPEPAEVVA